MTNSTTFQQFLRCSFCYDIGCSLKSSPLMHSVHSGLTAMEVNKYVWTIACSHSSLSHLWILSSQMWRQCVYTRIKMVIRSWLYLHVVLCHAQLCPLLYYSASLCNLLWCHVGELHQNAGFLFCFLRRILIGNFYGVIDWTITTWYLYFWLFLFIILWAFVNLLNRYSWFCFYDWHGISLVCCWKLVSCQAFLTIILIFFKQKRRTVKQDNLSSLHRVRQVFIECWCYLWYLLLKKERTC